MFRIETVDEEEGRVSGYLEITNGSIVSEFYLGTFGPISDDGYVRPGDYYAHYPTYVEFLEALRNRKECKFCCNKDIMCCSFMSNTDGTLTIYAETDSMGKRKFCYKFLNIPMTNEIFAEMEKLVITTNPSSFDTPEEAREWEEKLFPKDYVKGRGLAYM